jgi:hypothetical protein
MSASEVVMSNSTSRLPQPGIDRRVFLGASSLALGNFLHVVAMGDDHLTTNHDFRPYTDYQHLLATLRERGHRYRILGAAPDTSPVVAVKAGGTKKPAIFISAGSHSTEQAGVAAAVELIDRLETEHEVWIVPTRDPIGMNGFRYALKLGLGELPEIESLAAAEMLLRDRGEVLFDADDTLLVRIGEYGYANRGLYRQVEKGAPFLASLLGRRIYFPSRAEDQPGAGPLERAYTLVVTTDGEVLHLNRFHDTPWAPAEVLAIRQLMVEIQPGLTFDLHEHGGGDFFWLSARRQRTETDEIWERRMARAGIEAVARTGARLAPDDYSPCSFFEKLEPGVFWLDPHQRGEGLNLADFASAVYGPSFTIESGMRAPFDQRVRQQLRIVQTAVEVFAQRYA